MNEKKECPYCGEMIMATAKKCRYCGEWLAPQNPSPTIDTSKQGVAEPVPHVSTTNNPQVSSSAQSQEATDITDYFENRSFGELITWGHPLSKVCKYIGELLIGYIACIIICWTNSDEVTMSNLIYEFDHSFTHISWSGKLGLVIAFVGYIVDALTPILDIAIVYVLMRFNNYLVEKYKVNSTLFASFMCCTVLMGIVCVLGEFDVYSDMLAILTLVGLPVYAALGITIGVKLKQNWRLRSKEFERFCIMFAVQYGSCLLLIMAMLLAKIADTESYVLSIISTLIDMAYLSAVAKFMDMGTTKWIAGNRK